MCAQINFFDPQYRANPYPVLKKLQVEDPVHQDRNGIWIVTRHADVDALLRNPLLGRDYRRWHDYDRIRPFLADSPLEQSVEAWLFYRDPPDHTRLRRLIARAFTPSAMAAVRRTVALTVDVLLESVADLRELDFMTAFAQPLPMRVIAGIVGVPDSDYEELKRWSDALTAVLEPGSSLQARRTADTANQEFQAYLKCHVETRRRRARRESDEDLIDALISAESSGERLDEQELLGILVLLVLAGFETTSNLLGNGMLALLRHVDQLVRLRENGSLVDCAVEEFLRYETPAALNGRVLLQDVLLNGKRLPAGDLVFCMLAAANRDPLVFQHPDTLDISRRPNPHLSFGGGGRYCVGAPLARLEGQVAFERLVSSWREIEVDEARVRWRDLVNLRGLERLPIRVVH